MCGEGAGEFDDGELALAADDDVDVGLAEGGLGAEGGVPAAEDDGQGGGVELDELCRLDGAANHGAGEDGDADADGGGGVVADGFEVVRVDGGVDEDDGEAGRAQGAG